MNFRVAIVDDEAPARQRLEDLLAQDEQVSLCASFEDGHEAISGIQQLQLDILFLDIQMPGLNGFDVLQALTSEHLPVVIFATAYDQYALDAFERCALDYLLKPFEDERFFLALQRAKHQHQLNQLEAMRGPVDKLLELIAPSIEPTKKQFLSRIPVKTRKEVLLVSIQDVTYISAQGPYLEIHAHDKTHLIRERMNHLASQLDPQQFFRIHRSSLVNLHHVRSFVPLFRGEYAVEMKDGTQLRLSRGRKEALANHLGMSF